MHSLRRIADYYGFTSTQHGRGLLRRGVTPRGERRFNIGSGIVILLLAVGWSWSIVAGPPRGRQPSASRIGGIITSSLTDPRAPSIAYLTDAALNVFTPARGASGRLRVRIEQPGQTLAGDTLPEGAIATFSSPSAAESAAVFTAPRKPGIWSLAVALGGAIKPITDFSLITLTPSSQKRAGRIGLYYIGNWPALSRAPAGGNYSPPSGFIEVTRETQNTRLSDHFRVRDFFPHDQANIWPKYIVVDMRLIDKLELVLEDMRKHGIRTEGVKVMSGFRTPQYNVGGGDPRGRATLSRHMYGDAADIFIDNDGNGNMDDLNGDGRVNTEDARFIQAAVDRVEAAHPSLIGGTGVYPATSAHGPFTHIDTRGYRARW